MNADPHPSPLDEIRSALGMAQSTPDEHVVARVKELVLERLDGPSAEAALARLRETCAAVEASLREPAPRSSSDRAHLASVLWSARHEGTR